MLASIHALFFRPLPNMVMLSAVLSATAFGAASVTPDKTAYTLVEKINISYSGSPGNPTDWISVALAGTPDTGYLAFNLTAGKTSGTFSFDIMEPGNYEARLYFNNSYTVQARASFSVSYPNTTVTTDKSTYQLLDKIVVTFANMPGYFKDYITVVPIATPDNIYGHFQFTTSKNGVVTFDPPALTTTEGVWEARALYRNENGPVRARTRFVIGEPGLVLQTNKSAYALNEPITVTYSGMPGFPKDWIGLFTPPAANEQYLTYLNANGQKSGSMTFTAGLATAGTYEARGFFNNEHILKAKAQFTVGTSACSYSITTPPLTSPVAATMSLGDFMYVTASPATCTWTATADSWITARVNVGGGTVTGNGYVQWNVAANPGTSSRTGAIKVVGAGGAVGATYTITQLGSSSGCNFLVNPLNASIGGAGGEVLIQIVTALACDWSASSDTPWITITAGASGKGNGAVALQVLPNPSSSSSRTGTVTVAGQTVTVTQSPGPACTVKLTAFGVHLPGGGGSGKVTFDAEANCGWAALANASWITFSSSATGTGAGSVQFTVAPNSLPAPRASSITVGGQTLPVKQAAVNVVEVPVISDDGVVNTANYKSARPGVGSIAQGGYFSIYGAAIGPADFARASAYPLPTTLGGVSIRVGEGSNAVDAFLVFASKGQINAVLPSSTPVGVLPLTVTTGGDTSDPVAIRVSPTDLGLFFQRESDGTDRAISQNVASATDYPLNTPARPAKPGQIVILWGTGMGAIGTADNVAPGAGDMPQIPVDITVDGKTARRIYAGRQPETAAIDNVYFEVPSDIHFGCNVPVQVRAGGLAANTVVISITAQGGPCR